MKTLFLYRYDKPERNFTRDILVVFSSTQAFADEEFVQVVQASIDRDLPPELILIVVRDTAFCGTIDVFGRSKVIQNLCYSLPDHVNVLVVSFDRSGKNGRRHLVHGTNAPTASEVEFSHFRNRALTSLFRSREGFVQGGPIYHFINPSGRHTKQFMRLANVLVSGPEISFFAFCVLPLLDLSCHTLYVDTPALFSLVGAINDHLSCLNERHRFLADNFQSYDGLRNPTYAFNDPKNAMVLISASSSGSLANELAEKEPDIAAERKVHLVFLGTEEPHKIVCNLKYHPTNNPDGYSPPDEDWHAGSCKLCDSGSQAVRLKGQLFEMEDPQPEPLLVMRTDAPKDLDGLMSRSVGSRIFGVGFGDPRGTEPRQFDIDVNALQQSTSYQERLLYVLQQKVTASISAIVEFDSYSGWLATKIAKMSADEKGTTPPIFRHVELDRLPTNSRSRAPVVIAASVVDSGRRLLDISRELRTAYPEAGQLYVAGFQKVESTERETSLRNTLLLTPAAIRHDLVSVEKIMLPPSRSQHAWKIERDVFGQLLKDSALCDKIEMGGVNRIIRNLERLNKTRLVDDLFSTNELFGDRRPLELRHGFAFWPPNIVRTNATQADVFFTIASVLQRLRANSASVTNKRALWSGRLRQSRLAPFNFGRFNDGIIQACFLRAAQPGELNYSVSERDSEEMLRIVRRIVESSRNARGEAAAEFLIAIATDRLILWSGHYKYLLRKIEDAPAWIDTLLDVCRYVHNDK